jgi:hypothetical protein
MESMRVPPWLTLGVAILVCVFGAYRIRLAFRSDEEDARARERRGLYAMGRRTHFLIGLVYLLLGGALVATTYGWNPFGTLFAPGGSTPAPRRPASKAGIPVAPAPSAPAAQPAPSAPAAQPAPSPSR